MTCFSENCTANAPYGYRLPGPLSEQPADLKGKYLWSCLEHREEAAQRRDAAMKARGIV